MRVVFVHSNNTDIGGSDTVLLRVAHACRNSGHDVLVVLSVPSLMCEKYAQAGIEVNSVSMPRVTRSKNPLAHIRWCWQATVATIALARVFRRSSAEIVVANDYNELPAAVAAWLCGIPRLAILRFLFSANGLLRKTYIGLIALFNNRVLCVSRSVRDHNFQGLPRRLRQKATVLYDWFDVEPSSMAAESVVPTNVFARFGIADGARVLLMPSRVEPWKGQHVLIEALPEIFARCPDSVALFVGSSVTGRGREAYSAQLVRRAQELGIERRVFFAGHVEDIATVMRASAVVLHCSVTPEPFGMTILEAMALGTPVVAAGAGGPLEIAGDTESLLLHRPGDHVDLASQTLRVLLDDEFADNLRDLGRTRTLFFGTGSLACSRSTATRPRRERRAIAGNARSCSHTLPRRVLAMRMKVLSMSELEVVDVMVRLAMAVKHAKLQPSCVIGLLEGGRQPAELFARQWSESVPVEFVKIQRPSSGRLKHYVVRSLSVLPRTVVDFTRLCEMQWHEFRAARGRTQPLPLDIEPYVRQFRASPGVRAATPERPVVVVDDAIDSGTSIATVVEALRGADVVPEAIKLVCITHTLSQPRLRADYCGYHQVAIRFPWSSDYRPDARPRKPR